MKKILFAVLAIISLNASAISFPISESMVNSQVTKTFPRTIKKIELSNPQITLLEEKSILCMDGIPRIMFLEKKFKVCTSFKPGWIEKEARLIATDLDLTSIEINGVGNVPSSLRRLISETIVLIEPLSLYKSDFWIVKQVTAIEVEKGMLYLKF